MPGPADETERPSRAGASIERARVVGARDRPAEQREAANAARARCRAAPKIRIVPAIHVAPIVKPMRSALLSTFVLAVLPACESFQFEARDTETLHVAAGDVDGVRCQTHNGAIAIEAGLNLDRIQITAHKRIRAIDQETADAALRDLDIIAKVEGGTLQLFVPKRSTSTWNASVSFTVKMPKISSAKLSTHNGAIHLAGAGSKVEATTHNGAIRIDGDCTQIALETHNGAIACKLRGQGAVDGEIETHNGGVAVELDAARSVAIAARTHNGSMSTREPIQVTEVEKRRMHAHLGSGEGKLRIQTHNGNIRVSATR